MSIAGLKGVFEEVPNFQKKLHHRMKFEKSFLERYSRKVSWYDWEKIKRNLSLLDVIWVRLQVSPPIP